MKINRKQLRQLIESTIKEGSDTREALRSDLEDEYPGMTIGLSQEMNLGGEGLGKYGAVEGATQQAISDWMRQAGTERIPRTPARSKRDGRPADVEIVHKIKNGESYMACIGSK